ncbi:MAG TPA: CHRD domain-containing protein [Actinomycetota bacterium]|jgi:hypothetical protein
MARFRRLVPFVLLSGALALAAIAPAAARDAKPPPVRFVTLQTQLSGANEVPPADPDGVGVAEINVAARSGTLCFAIAVENITLPATAAHIHQAPAGSNGDIVVPLEPPVGFGSGSTGVSAGCLTGLSTKLLQAIERHPEQYYVNVHNADFPPGAVRGQLEVA